MTQLKLARFLFLFPFPGPRAGSGPLSQQPGCPPGCKNSIRGVTDSKQSVPLSCGWRFSQLGCPALVGKELFRVWSFFPLPSTPAPPYTLVLRHENAVISPAGAAGHWGGRRCAETLRTRGLTSKAGCGEVDTISKSKWQRTDRGTSFGGSRLFIQDSQLLILGSESRIIILNLIIWISK